MRRQPNMVSAPHNNSLDPSGGSVFPLDSEQLWSVATDFRKSFA